MFSPIDAVNNQTRRADLVVASSGKTLQAVLVATFDAIGEPVGREFARDFWALQRDLRQYGARRRSPR